jgi:hypothetical protein
MEHDDGISGTRISAPTNLSQLAEQLDTVSKQSCAQTNAER